MPAILLALVAKTLGIPDGEIRFVNWFPVATIQLIFTPALIFGFVVGILGLKKFWADMKQAGGVTSGDLKSSIVETVKEFLSHKKFKDCVVSKDRFLSHFLVFYGFVFLGIATAIGVLSILISCTRNLLFLWGTGHPLNFLETSVLLHFLPVSSL